MFDILGWITRDHKEVKREMKNKYGIANNATVINEIERMTR